jgi:LacI family transcriptional regulator
MSPPNLKRIAEIAGVSVSTVSRALHQHPRIPQSTREHIAKIASDLGYRPDARLAQLMTHLRAGKRSRGSCNLGWLDTWNDPEEGNHPWNRNYFLGAAERAEEAGYALDLISAQELRRSPARINSILKSRGIEGLILPQFFADHPVAAKIAWADYSIVFLDEFHPQLPGSRVSAHASVNTMLMMRRLRELGYRRPGFWLSRFLDVTSLHAYSAFIPWAQHSWYPKPHLPVFPAHKIELDAYLKKHRPDVLVAATNTILEELSELGFRVPEDIGVSHVNLAEDVPGWAGIDQSHWQIGQAAVDALIAQIQRHEIGVSRFSKQIYIPGEWRDGFTARNVAAP